MSPKYPQFQKLSDFLKAKKVSPDTEIRFYEESDADNKYALTVGAKSPQLLRDLARFWGAPSNAILGEDDGEFEASDRWHGQGEGNLRELADELGIWDAPLFDTLLEVEEIHEIGAEEKAEETKPEIQRELAAYGLLSRMHAAISNFQGHGMPGFTDRAEATILLQECAAFLGKPPAIQTPDLPSPASENKNIRIQTKHKGDQTKTWVLPGRELRLLTETNDTLFKIRIGDRGELHIQSGSPCEMQGTLLMEDMQILPLSRHTLTLRRTPFQKSE